ncbi:type II secretion system major pseudopilin GspG [Frigidibacter sp. SD6-1]|uniref:type II secretion system major pseudopilin GspG n=1 Tax=Frigidibacter sp. SD6-1 TaxID=3032581 RepID=UPI0024DF8D83|nr:type II secretion system major pseudopilin GspG [Frigidibacter sp. SD6-1]
MKLVVWGGGKASVGRNAGMTILEVLVVLAIVAMIAAVVGPRLIGYLGRAKSETAALQIDQLESALQLFFVDVGRYPTSAEGLAVLVQSPAEGTGWRGPYIDKAEALKDPWGRDYVYEEPVGDASPVVMSLGRDGAKGGDGEDADLGL